MKRLLPLICLCILLAGCSAPRNQAQENEQDQYRLVFEAQLLCNDTVGNNWFVTYTYNGQKIYSGYKITVPAQESAFAILGVEVREDDKIDDVAYATLSVRLSKDESDSINLTVTEKHGRYKNNTATWKIACSVVKA